MKQLIPLVLLANCIAATPLSAQETERFFPAAASAPGANNTFFKTDARLFNPSADESVTINMQFLRRGSDNTGADSEVITLGPRMGAALDDLVASVFALENVAGGVRLSASMPFLASQRTYNIGDGSSGTFGQFIPGQTSDEALASGILLSIVNDPSDSGFRSNIGFANPNETTIEVHWKVFDAENAALLGEGMRNVAPWAVVQISDVFRVIGEAALVVNNATVEFSATMPVLAYASVVDNTSGDAVYVLPQADDGTPDEPPVNNPPNGEIVVPADDTEVELGVPVAFEASATDPDGDDVTGMEWDFGDGITANGLSVQHTFSEAGTFSVRFTATDDQGLSDPEPPVRMVTVTQPEPSATLSEVQAQIFDQSCAFSGCHGNGSASSGLNLDAGNSHGNLVGVSSAQKPELMRIAPGEPEQSYLWLKVTGDSSISGAQMPRGGDPLPQNLLDLLESWILGGALDD